MVVLPITSNVASLYPGEAQTRVGGKAARALGDQIRSIDRSRIRKRIGALGSEDLERVEEAIRITLALGN